LEGQFLAHGGEFPSTLVPCLVGTAPPFDSCPFHPFPTPSAHITLLTTTTSTISAFFVRDNYDTHFLWLRRQWSYVKPQCCFPQTRNYFLYVLRPLFLMSCCFLVKYTKKVFTNIIKQAHSTGWYPQYNKRYYKERQHVVFMERHHLSTYNNKKLVRNGLLVSAHRSDYTVQSSEPVCWTVRTESDWFKKQIENNLAWCLLPSALWYLERGNHKMDDGLPGGLWIDWLIHGGILEWRIGCLDSLHCGWKVCLFLYTVTHTSIRYCTYV
jgi:hypothetical protein